MIQFAEKGSPHVIEDPCLMPVSQTSPTRGRARILSGKILPSRPSLEYPEYSLKARTVIRWGTSSLRPRWPRGNELSDPLPLLIGQHRFTHTHRITSDQCVTRKARLVQVLFQRYFGNIEVLKLALITNKCHFRLSHKSEYRCSRGTGSSSMSAGTSVTASLGGTDGSKLLSSVPWSVRVTDVRN